MRRNNAAIILLLSVLAPWAVSFWHQRPSYAGQGSDKRVFLAEQAKTSYQSELVDHSSLPSAFEMKGQRPRVKKIIVPFFNNLLRKQTESLNVAPNLSLPTKSSDVNIEELRPIKLEDIERLVEINNPILKAAASKVSQSKSLLLASLTTWYPQVNLTANGLPEYLSAELFTDPYYTSAKKGYSNSRQWRSAVTVQVEWNLIDPRRVPEIAAARDTYEQTKFSYMVVLRDAKLQAISQYFVLQKADEGVRIGQESVKASLMSLKDAESRFKAGVATKLEVLEAETQLARDKQLFTRKIGEQKIARRTLAQQLNLPPNITPTAASPAQVLGLWQPSLQDSIISAYAFREELDQLILDISINNSKANQALATVQPILSIVNSFTHTRYQGQLGVSAANPIDMDEYGWSNTNTIGLNASWRIFDGGRAKANYNYSKHKAKESEAKFAEERDKIRMQVETSFFNLQTANQEILSTSREVLAARESLRLARLRYQAGITTQREVVNNQRDLTRAEVRYADAIASYNISLSQLRRRTGLDSIKSCKSKLSNPSSTKKSSEANQTLVEPIPMKPACQVVNSKKQPSS